jgi:hypothetical protein
MVPSGNSIDLARRLPNAELVLYEDAGHGGIFQYHEAFVKCIVIVGVECPSRPCTAFRSAPRAWVSRANMTRRSWGRSRGMPRATRAFAQYFLKVESVGREAKDRSPGGR